jgi:hypothetical protein
LPSGFSDTEELKAAKEMRNSFFYLYKDIRHKVFHPSKGNISEITNR